MPVLVVGSVAFDTVRTPFGSGEEVLGGSASYFSVSASYFTQVRLVAAVGEDFLDRDRELLRARGVDLSGLRSVPGRTFRWEGEYGYDLNNARTLRTELGVFSTFRPEIPEAFRDSEVVFLANIDPEIQLEVLGQARAPRLIACDTMNFWIDGKREALLRTLARVDALLINDAEARQLTGEPNLVRAAQAILAMGPKTVVIKRGEYGALMFHEHSVFSAPAFPLEKVLDPTGAGDSFAGGFIGYLAKHADFGERAMRRAVIVGSVMASLNVEDFSLRRLMRTNEAEIAARYKEFERLTSFEKLV
jgi:sugar/nucleoside kinase (ribokinase family)